LDTGELTAVTGAGGTYTFSNVPIGTYVIRQVLLTGYSQTSPGGGSGIHITIAAGSSLTGESFVDSILIPVKLTGAVIGTSGSYNNDGDTIAKAFDGNASTFFNGPTANGDWVGLDLGSSKTIKQVSFVPRSGSGSRLVGGKIQISTTANFSSGLTTVYTITTAPSDGSTTLVTLSSPVTARYVRYLAPDGAYGNIAELAFFG
jgi:hypothetical protein